MSLSEMSYSLQVRRGGGGGGIRTSSGIICYFFKSMFVIEGKNTLETMGQKLTSVGSARARFSRTKFRYSIISI